jgi:hypothetical protein
MSEAKASAKRGPIYALVLVGAAGVTATLLQARNKPSEAAPAASASASAAASAFEAMAKTILDAIEKQESAKDATCWTTVRMIESFSIGLQLAPEAELARIDASRQR